MAMTRILVPTDFSDAATRALEYGSRLASALGAELAVLHVVEPASGRALTGTTPQPVDMLTDAWFADAGTLLAHAMASIDERVCVTGTVSIGSEAEEILRFAVDHEVDLIVMGMHGHGVATRLIRGSVTNRVLRRASCPVLAIPACAGGLHAPEMLSFPAMAASLSA